MSDRRDGFLTALIVVTVFAIGIGVACFERSQCLTMLRESRTAADSLAVSSASKCFYFVRWGTP